MPRRKLCQAGGKSHAHRSLLIADEQIYMSYLWLFADESLSYQKQGFTS
jgi:hypothetical protein